VLGLIKALKKLLDGAVKVAIVGVGSELKGDDRVGLEVARRLKRLKLANVLVVEAGTMPENFTGVLRRFEPSHVVFVDAAQFNGSPGDVVVTSDISSLGGVTFSTHHTPLSMVARYLQETVNAYVIFVGVQPKSALGEKLSPEVEESLEALVTILEKVLLDVLSKQVGDVQVGEG